MERWIETTAAQVAAGITGTSAGQVNATVQAWQETPAEERPSLAPLLVLIFGLARAALIAITETGRGFNHGWRGRVDETIGPLRFEAEPPLHPRCRCWMRIQPRPAGGWQVLWITALDERVCGLCGPRHGLEVGGTV